MISLSIFVSCAPLGLEYVIDCVTMTVKRGNSHHHIGAHLIKRSVLSDVQWSAFA